MRYKYISALSLMAVLASCEKEINVKVPEYKPQLVINSNTEVNDTIRVAIGRSAGILNYKAGQNMAVAGAMVQLYKGNSMVEVMRYDSTRWEYVSNTIADEGEQYSVKVTAPGFAEAAASTKVPKFVPIVNVQRSAKVRLDMDNQLQDELRLTFNDPPAAGDYYIVSILKTSDNDDSLGYTSCVNTVDASVESIYNENIDQNTCLNANAIFFRDALFNGTTKELKLFVNSSFLENAGTTYHTQLVLQHVTEDYFKFQKTYQFASENSGNPFSEPTNVYTNVKNGYGVFSIISYDIVEIK